MSTKEKALQVGEKFLIPVAAGTLSGVAANQFPQNQRSTKRVLDAKKIKKVEKNWEIEKREIPGFNDRAAAEAFDIVMKMDPDTAREFIYHVTQEVLDETIEKNQRTLQRHLNEVVAKRIERVKKQMVRGAVIKSADAMPYAQALSVFEKAIRNPYLTGAYHFQESDFRRDPETGRFQTKIRGNPRRAPSAGPVSHERLGIPVHRAQEQMTAEQQKKYRDEYMQLAQFLGNIQASGTQLGDNDITLNLRNRRTGERYDVSVSGKSKQGLADSWNPKEEDLVGAEAQPSTVQMGGAVYDLTGSLGAARGTKAVDQGFGDFARDWTAPKDDTNSRLYGRIGAGSRLLGAVGAATGQPHVQAAAAFGQFVGAHGSEAEAVFGPPTRKMAYRYRGTEKAPEKDMVRAYTVAVNRAKSRTDEPAGRTGGGLHGVAERRSASNRREPTFEELAEGRDAVIEHLMSKAPSSRLYGLQLAAGNTPPSEGVIINAQGQIATQAVGYGDDHYLPFNLRHLKDLKGGEYIRTRSVGGPTTEDIYTGLMSGARQVTVASRSGVYTVTFEPDFRGGRRHNDKAKRMVKRYGQLLDAVQSEQVESMPLDEDVRQQLQAEVRDKYQGVQMTRQQWRDAYRAREEDFKENPDISPEDEDLIARLAANPPEGKDAKEYARYQRNRIMASKEHTYRLNANGYQSALEALQEQFPYYIKVFERRPIHEADRESQGTRDRGYVAPGDIRPAAAGAGLYGVKHSFKRVDGKYPASEAHMVGRQVHRGGGEGGEKTEETPKTPQGGGPQSRIAANIEANKGVDRAEAVVRNAGGINIGDGYPTMKAAKAAHQRGDFAVWYRQGDNAKKLQAEANDIASLSDAHRQTLDTNGALTAMVNPPPELGDDVKQRDAWNALSGRKGIKHDKPLTEMSDAELQEEHDTAERAVRHGGDYDDLTPDELAQLKNAAGAAQVPSSFSSKKGREEHLAAVKQVRGLRTERKPEETPTVVRQAPSTQESQAQSTTGVSQMVNRLQAAATKAESQGNDDDADELWLAASNFKEAARQGSLSRADIEPLYAANTTGLQRLGKYEKKS